MSGIDRIGVANTQQFGAVVGGETPSSQVKDAPRIDASLPVTTLNAKPQSQETKPGMSPPVVQEQDDAWTDMGAVQAQAKKPIDMSEVHTLFLEFMLTYRKAARLNRQSALEGQVTQLLGSADKMRDAAKENFKASIIQGVTSIVGGAIQGGLAVMQGRVLSEMKGNLSQPRQPKLENLDTPAPNPSSKTGPKSSLEAQMDELDKLDPGTQVANNRQAGPIKENSALDTRPQAANNRQSAPIKENPALETGPPAANKRQSATVEDEPTPGTRDSSPAAKPNAKDGVKEAEADAISPGMDTKRDEFQRLTTKSQMFNSFSQFGGGIVDGAGKIWSAINTRDGAELQADSQELDALAKKAEAAYSLASEGAQNAQEAINKVLGIAEDINRTTHETNQTIARI